MDWDGLNEQTRLAEIAARMPAAVTVLNIDGRLLFYNDDARNILTASRSIWAATWACVISRRTRPAYRACWKATAGAGEGSIPIAPNARAAPWPCGSPPGLRAAGVWA